VNVTELRLAPQTNRLERSEACAAAIGGSGFLLDSVQDLIDSQRFGEASCSCRISIDFPGLRNTIGVCGGLRESEAERTRGERYQRALALKLPQIHGCSLHGFIARQSTGFRTTGVEEALKLEPRNSAAVSLKAELDRPAGSDGGDNEKNPAPDPDSSRFHR